MMLSRMTVLLTAVGAVALVATVRVWTQAPEAATAQVTITGQVVCLVCYTRNPENFGEDHDSGRACAQACIKWEGNPAGLLTTDGVLYQLAGDVVADNNERIAPHVAHRVTITGESYEKDGMRILAGSDVMRSDATRAR